MSSTTNWTCSVDTSSGTPVASLMQSVNGAAPVPFILKGLCYSPAPINGSNASAPAIGDWFWDDFSGQGFGITGWDALWQRDIPNLQSLGANTIRVYSMLSRQLNTDGTFPSPWNSGQLQTHQSFLDQCWNDGVNPLYVLVGIPLPSNMFWQEQYNSTPQDQITFWTNVLSETVTQVAGHPAVLGFVIQNELDSGVVTYGPNTGYVQFWWSQVQTLAAAAKTAMGTNQKLVGMAVHDDPNIAGQAASYMAQCPAMDFWGVNTYQTINFSSVFGPVPNIGPGYAGLTGAALKPVIFTEWGMPATGHHSATDPSTIYADAATIANAAKVIAAVGPLAYPPTQSLCLGMYYFEYCDEWWNQPGAPNIYTWYGGTPAPGFPNGYWDQDGFGIFSQQRGAGLSNNSPIWQQTGGYGGPATPIDVVTVRTGTFNALQQVFSDITFFTVQSTLPWQSAGVTVPAGSTVTITFLSGAWTANPNDNGGKLYDANGNPTFIVAKPGYTMPGQDEGALIGSIGTDVFLVGDSLTMTATTGGELQLCINDDLKGQYGSGLKDNIGQITVRITIG